MTLNRKLFTRSAVALAAGLACAGGASAQSADAWNPSDYVLLNGSAIRPDKDWPAHKTGGGGGPSS